MIFGSGGFVKEIHNGIFPLSDTRFVGGFGIVDDDVDVDVDDIPSITLRPTATGPLSALGPRGTRRADRAVDEYNLTRS